MSLILLDRPWLSSKDFNTEFSAVTKALDDQIETDLFSRLKLSKINELNKVEKIKKNYKYKNILMSNYGALIFDKNNNLIGYKINEYELASVEIFYNESNLLCNKVSIQDYDYDNLSLTLKKII